MIKTFSKVLGLLIAALFIFTGCEDKTVVTETKPKIMQEKPVAQGKIETHAAKKVETKMATPKKRDLSNIVQDNSKISSNGKYGLIIFESSTCKYCDQLKDDILASDILKNRLANDFSTYTLSIDTNKMHLLDHQGEMSQVDTNTLKDIYGIQATPTLIFTDKQTQSILVVPGYMGPEQFEATLEFIDSKRWEGVNRKTGDIYKELKQFYIEKGIIKES
ncbi:MAG TPA: phosphoribosylformylglycinamidine cyclo-ligase [Sulfurospirillum arcachonense]|nr:phosphoribosylformylglycinamidine cyclo-ligase [Sulfurospirillum arcachonense]